MKMIIEFTVGNYRSIAEPQTLSMVAADIASENDNGIIDAGDMKLLRVAAIYGANASGKSNLWQALKVFQNFVFRSDSYYQLGEPLPAQPFLLKEGYQDKPSFFELVVLLEGNVYRYGFEINGKQVESEWLFVKKSSRETRFFTRVRQDIDVNTRAFPEAKDIVKRTREDALLLSVAVQWNGKVARKIRDAVTKIFTTTGSKMHSHISAAMFQSDLGKEMIATFFNKVDIGFNEMILEKSESDEAKSSISKIKTLHSVYDSHGNITGTCKLDLHEQGSEGTLKLFSLASILIFTLENGAIFSVDELDAQLHPLMTRAIINLFNSPKTNPNNAQLIFNTHDTNLLKPDLLRRDQIWFTEKDRFGATHLYSLAEFRQEDGTLPRKDADFEEHYIQGRYGAIPYLGDFSDIVVARTPEKEAAPVAKPAKKASSAKKATSDKTVKPATKKTARKKAVKNG